MIHNSVIPWQAKPLATALRGAQWTSLNFTENSGKGIKSRRMIREASAKREVFTFNGSTAERGETSQKPYL